MTWKIPEARADISESDIRHQDEEVLRLLLVDRTLTSHNGRWTSIKMDFKVITPRVRCRAYRGTDKSVWYAQRECEGPIAEQIHDAYAFVCKNMRVGFELVARYFTDWTAAGLPRPKFEDTPGFFKVVFDRKKRTNEPVNDPINEPIKSAVVREVRKSPGISRPALMRVVGKSRATMTRILSELVEWGSIEHRGSDKTGGYYSVSSAQKEAK